MPYTSMEGVGVGCIVENTGNPLSIPVGDELLGHTVDGIGRPTDISEDESLELELNIRGCVATRPYEPCNHFRCTAAWCKGGGWSDYGR